MTRMKREITDSKQRLVNELQDRGLSSEQRARVRSRYTNEIKRRMELLQTYAKESEINPRLSTAR